MLKSTKQSTTSWEKINEKLRNNFKTNKSNVKATNVLIGSSKKRKKGNVVNEKNKNINPKIKENVNNIVKKIRNETAITNVKSVRINAFKSTSINETTFKQI